MISHSTVFVAIYNTTIFVWTILFCFVDLIYVKGLHLLNQKKKQQQLQQLFRIRSFLHLWISLFSFLFESTIYIFFCFSFDDDDDDDYYRYYCLLKNNIFFLEIICNSIDWLLKSNFFYSVYLIYIFIPVL